MDMFRSGGEHQQQLSIVRHAGVFVAQQQFPNILPQ